MWPAFGGLWLALASLGRRQLWPSLAGRGQLPSSVFAHSQAPLPAPALPAPPDPPPLLPPKQPAPPAHAARGRAVARSPHAASTTTPVPPAVQPLDPSVARMDLRPPTTVAAGAAHAGGISGDRTAAPVTLPPSQGSKGRTAAVLGGFGASRGPLRRRRKRKEVGAGGLTAAARVPARSNTKLKFIILQLCENKL